MRKQNMNGLTCCVGTGQGAAGILIFKINSTRRTY